MGMCKTCKYFTPNMPFYQPRCKACDGYRNYESNAEPAGLRPCPFCGGEAELCKDSRPDWYCSYEVAYVACKDCGVRTNDYITDGYYGVKTSAKDAIDVWNRRV